MIEETRGARKRDSVGVRVGASTTPSAANGRFLLRNAVLRAIPLQLTC